MGENDRSLFTQQLLSSQSPDFSLKSAPFIGHSGLNTWMFNTVSSQEGLPLCASGLVPLNTRIGQFNQHQGWFYCLPRFRQAFTPGPNFSALKHKLPINYGNSELNAEKKFLVFDQSGDQTTVMVSSGPGTPFRCVTSWSLKPPAQPNVEDVAHGGKLDSYPACGSIAVDSNNEETDVASEMHEDTDELNALLYSDDEGESYYSEDDDEVTSTGHSPSTMTAHERPDHFHREDEEDEASSGWPKKRKWNGDDDVEAFGDTASSCDVNGLSNYLSNDDGAESSCAKRENSGFLKMDLSSSASKRMHREKIRKTVGLLQETIPGGKGKDSIVVLDEAINYLKSLKARAIALGLATL